MTTDETVWVMLHGVPGGPVRLTVPPPDTTPLPERLARAKAALADAVAEMNRYASTLPDLKEPR